MRKARRNSFVRLLTLVAVRRGCSEWATWVASIAMLGLAAFSPAVGEEVVLETDSVTRDYGEELPRIQPTEPAAALKTFQLAPGFRIELVAHEPLVTDPIAASFDGRGRMFVVCMRGYSEDRDDKLGMVRMLTDADQDGVFDEGTDFLTGLAWPTAIACYDDGVFIAAPPNLIFARDTDGDGVADKQEVVATGFNRHNVQGMVNSLRWGLDNWLYGATGTVGGKINTVGDGKTTLLKGRDFSIDPATRELRAESGGAQHGATFDRWGNRFVCSNSDHVQWVEFADRHLRRNSLLRGFRSRRSIAAEGPAAEVFRTSEVEPWRIVRTRLRVKGMVGGPVEGGGRAAGYFTSASGVTAYTGDAFAQKYRAGDFLFIGDVGSNLVHLKSVRSEGLNKTATRATEPGQEFLTSTDNWFRPVQFANSPDGGLTILDMYREVIEHPLSLPPMIKKHLDLTSGRSRGRIYRVVPDDWKFASRELPAEANRESLVAMLGHTNGWHRETAARLIVTRGRDEAEKRALVPLLTAACGSESPLARVRALYCLRTLGQLEGTAGSRLLVQALKDPHRQVRIHALRILDLMPSIESSVAECMAEMVADRDAEVRYELALTAGRLDWPTRKPILVALAQGAENESKQRFAILSSMAVGAASENRRLELMSALLDVKGDSKSGSGSKPLLEELARQIGAERRSGSNIAEAVALAARHPAMKQTLISNLLIGVGKSGQPLIESLQRSGVANPEQLVSEQLQAAAQQCENVASTIEERRFALRVLSLGEYRDVGDAISRLLLPQQAAEIRTAAVDTLGQFESVEAARSLVEALDGLPALARRRAIDSLTSRAAWAKELLDAVEDGRLTPTQLSATQRGRLCKNVDPDVAKRAGQLLMTDAKAVDRGQLVKEWQDVLELRGEVNAGRKHFRKSCSSCHRLEEHGTNVGPDLNPLRNRGAAFMLSNILDPNREVDPRYEGYTLLSDDGKWISGLLESDTDTSVELRLADGTRSRMDKADVDVLKSTGQSFMPEGLEQDLGKQGLADIIAYLIER